MSNIQFSDKWSRTDLICNLIGQCEEWELRRVLFAVIYDIGALASFTSNLEEYEPTDEQSQRGLCRVRDATNAVIAL